jgi:hypothetical protein
LLKSILDAVSSSDIHCRILRLEQGTQEGIEASGHDSAHTFFYVKLVSVMPYIFLKSKGDEE